MPDFAEFPYQRLPRLSRHEARARSAWAAAGPARDLVEGAAALRGLLGVAPEVEVAQAWTEGSPPPPGAAQPTVLLEGPAQAALTLEPALGAALVGRALGSATEPSVGPLLELERGVLAYVLGRWLAAGPWRVSAVLPHPAPLSCADLPVRWPLEVRLADRRYAAAAWLPRDAPTVPPRRPDPGWRARVRVAIGAATLRRATARTLAPGDTLIPDRLATDAATLIVGRSRWRARPIERGWQIEHQEPPMSDPDEPLALDAPITLTVELAHMEVSLEAIAGLAPGAVLETGRPIGGPVTLRAGGAVLARGELVDVEGELGVRILETARATDSRATDSRSKGSRSTG